MDDSLTLDKAQKLARQPEAVQEHHFILKNAKNGYWLWKWMETAIKISLQMSYSMSTKQHNEKCLWCGYNIISNEICWMLYQKCNYIPTIMLINNYKYTKNFQLE